MKSTTETMALLDELFHEEVANGADWIAQKIWDLKQRCHKMTPQEVGSEIFTIYDEHIKLL